MADFTKDKFDTNKQTGFAPASVVQISAYRRKCFGGFFGGSSALDELTGKFLQSFIAELRGETGGDYEISEILIAEIKTSVLQTLLTGEMADDGGGSDFAEAGSENRSHRQASLLEGFRLYVVPEIEARPIGLLIEFLIFGALCVLIFAFFLGIGA